MQRVLLGAALLAAAGCAIKSTYLRPDYEQSYRKTLKRIVIEVDVPEGVPDVAAELAGRIARRYVNMRKNYLVLRNGRSPLPPAAKTGADGVLALDFSRLAPADGDIDIALEARLTDARGATVIWAVEAEREGEAADEDLSKLAGRYRKELGPAAEPYVAPMFVLLKTVLDRLPDPELDDDDIAAKIELEE